MRQRIFAVGAPGTAGFVKRVPTGVWGGRYDYRKCMTPSTNPDHLVPSMPSPTNVPPLQIADQYVAGRKHG